MLSSRGFWVTRSPVLREEGVEIPPDLEVRVVENTDRVFHLVLPPKPNAAELTDELLGAVAAAASGNNCMWVPGPMSANCRDNKPSDTWMG